VLVPFDPKGSVRNMGLGVELKEFFPTHLKDYGQTLIPPIAFKHSAVNLILNFAKGNPSIQTN